MIGSGIRTDAVSRGGGAFDALKRLKSGQEKFGKAKFGSVRLLNFGSEGRSNFGNELKSGQAKALKLGKAKRLRFGKALAVAPPTIARAANDTMIAGTRLEGACGGTSGGLLSCVALSGVSVTCVPHVSAQSQNLPTARSKIKKCRRVDNPATSRAIAQPKSA